MAPAELESLILSHPGILEVAVIGVPDKEAGELPRAFCVKSGKGTVTEADVYDFVKDMTFENIKLLLCYLFIWFL